VSGYQGSDSVLTAGLTRFASSLMESLGDAVEVAQTDDITANGATARSLVVAIEQGTCDVGYIASGYLTARVRELAVADLPFSVADRHAAFAALAGRAGVLLRGALEVATGYRLLGFWDNGFRHLTNHVRPIIRVEDCAGLVIRTLDNTIYRETMSAMGFTPVVTDVRELREAVATHRVDAQENPLTNAVIFGLHRHHKYVSMTGHFFGLALFVCNAAWLAGLPEEMRARIEDAANAATAEQRRLAEVQDTEALRRLRAEGVAVLGPSEIDRDSFQRACAAILNREREKLDPRLVDAYLGG
jgi:TRAP-type C4-dicarboxylate transport system substrate-binding protein